MERAINDATLKQAGNIYQYLIALRDCYELKEGETLQIEVNGDVSIINKNQGIYQREVKHHFGEQNLNDRDIDFWKTLANWYTDYERVKNFSSFILSTTAIITATSAFSEWNDLDKLQKLKCIINIGEKQREREETFRSQYKRIFNDSYDKNKLLEILDKFTIESAQTSLKGISREFTRYIGHIPEENRDFYIGALLGEILIQVKDPPHKWEITKADFDKLLQIESATHYKSGTIPLPDLYAHAEVPEEEIASLEQKKFVKAIREIEYEKKIIDAISDYWKADITIARYLQNNFMYLESIDAYREDLFKRMLYEKDNSEIEAEDANDKEQLKISKRLYNNVMLWQANDFGSIIRNQDFFQRGVIHNIVDETDFSWKVGGE